MRLTINLFAVAAMLTTSLCKCICGSGKRDHFDPHRALGTPDLDALEEVDEPPFQPPQISGLLSYMVLADQPLRGAPIRGGELWYLSTEERVEPVTFNLYVNGFSFVHNSKEFSCSLSPFSLVRNCRFQSSYSSLNLADFKIFKVSLFTQGICYYYGVRGEDERQAEEERSRWVLDISRAMRLVTQSLFPPFSIACDPLLHVQSTHRRLMAGYLVHHDDVAVASVLYCELHPQYEDHAKLVLYENELCQTAVMDIYLSERSICCEKVGINCSCFCIEDHQFSTRTLSERKLWLRAISNVKVKLQNRAPAPSNDDLRHYRLAIKEHIGTIRATLESTPAMDALLQKNPRRPYGIGGKEHGDYTNGPEVAANGVGCGWSEMDGEVALVANPPPVSGATNDESAPQQAPSVTVPEPNTNSRWRSAEPLAPPGSLVSHAATTTPANDTVEQGDVGNSDLGAIQLRVKSTPSSCGGEGQHAASEVGADDNHAGKVAAAVANGSAVDGPAPRTAPRDLDRHAAVEAGATERPPSAPPSPH